MHSTTNFSFSFLNCGLIISIFSCSIYFLSGCLLISTSFHIFLFSIAVFLLIFLFSIAVSYFYFFSELRSFYFTSAQPEKLTVRDTLDECPKKKTLQKTKKNWKSFILFPQISLLLRLVNHNWHLIMISRWQTSYTKFFEIKCTYW